MKYEISSPEGLRAYIAAEEPRCGTCGQPVTSDEVVFYAINGGLEFYHHGACDAASGLQDL